MKKRDQINSLLVGSMLLSTIIYNLCATTCSVEWLLFAKITRTVFLVGLVLANISKTSHIVNVFLSSVFVSYSVVKIFALNFCALITNDFTSFVIAVDSSRNTCLFISVFLFVCLMFIFKAKNDTDTGK